MEAAEHGSSKLSEVVDKHGVLVDFAKQSWFAGVKRDLQEFCGIVRVGVGGWEVGCV